MASVQMQLLALLLRTVYKPRFATDAAGRAMLARQKRSSTPPRSLTRRCSVRGERVGGFDVHVVRWSDAPVGAGEGPAVVYLHGGAYCNEIVSQHWGLIADLAERTGAEVHVPIYGLAPQHTGVEALAFVMEVLGGLGATGRPVHLIGDSAGGGLALIAAQAAIGKSAVPLTGATLIAPWLDLSMSNPGVDAVEPTDPWLTRAGLHPIAEAWAGGVDVHDARLSPINGELRGLPPIDLWVGTRDITMPDCRLLRDRLPAASLAGYHELDGAVHVTPLLPVPEGRASRRAIVEGVARRLADASGRAAGPR
ncbi:alpha/beta hydrolase fold domain-containing protein [Agrococcus sp. Ld7]|uniref:alpha/beta hydrolase fold domain-containing protein n=1 Tax=Agrococcus sp. Ld7 TaxID=649148 RepID=UPI003864FFB1